MREALLRRNITIIAIASVVLAGLILLIMKLRFFDTVNADLKTANDKYTQANTDGAKLEANLIAERIATNNEAFAQQQTEVFRQRFRSLTFDLNQAPPPLDPETPRKTTWQRYMNEYYSDYGVELRRVLIQAADESGVILTTSVKVMAPPQNPEEVVTPPGGFLKPLAGSDLASVHVTGKLPQILNFFERVNQSEILMTTGVAGSVGVKIEASSTGVEVASFSMTPYLVASGPSALLPAAAAAASTTTSGSAPTTPSAGTTP